MIAGCPNCSSRYRVDAARIGPDGARLRCTKCSAVFLVRVPADAAETARKVEAPPPRPTSPQGEQLKPGTVKDRSRLVLIGDSDPARAKLSAAAIEDWGLEPILVGDGVAAMLSIQRMLPRAVVLEAGLPKMLGGEICEIVKRNESLRETLVVVVGVSHPEERYRFEDSALYGPDVCLEQPDLPDALKAILREAGLPSQMDDAGPGGSEASSAPDAQDEARDHVVRESPDATNGGEDPSIGAEREKALRLARIAVSEMALYQPERFDEASRAGTLEEIFALEVNEARLLLRQRIGEQVRAETDFVLDELQRVAAERSSQG